MKQKIRLLNHICIVICILVSGCRDLVKDEFDEFATTPVVNSLFTNDVPLEINVSFTGNINATEFDYAEEADVLLFVNDILLERPVYIGEGTYKTNQLIPNKNKISCQIIIDGYNTVYCEDSIPNQTIITDLGHISASGVNEEGDVYPAIKFTFQNNPEEKQYYEVRIRLLRSFGEKYAMLEKITDPVILNEGIPLAVFSNELIKDTLYEMTLNYTTGSSNSSGMKFFPLIIEFRTISYNYYQYRKQHYLYELGRDPDGISSSTTVFNMHTNIENGYGIFAGYTSYLSDTIYPLNHMY